MSAIVSPDRRVTLRNTVTIAVALLAVLAVALCDWWLGGLVVTSAQRGDAWLKVHTGVSLGHVALSVLTLIVAGLTVAGVLDPRRRTVTSPASQRGATASRRASSPMVHCCVWGVTPRLYNDCRVVAITVFTRVAASHPSRRAPGLTLQRL